MDGIPSEKEIVSSEIDLGEISKLQMEKIEELTLYAIQQDKEIKSLQSEIDLIKSRLGY